MSLKIKNSIAEQLVNGWYDNKKMSYVVDMSYHNADSQKPESLIEISKDFNVSRISLELPCKIFIANNYRELNEALWANKKRDDLIKLAKKYLGVKPRNKIGLIVPMRQGDKKSDWKTVK